jgi:poly-gamma-glutamate synthesis protein (capsule biosynthesis protein)
MPGRHRRRGGAARSLAALLALAAVLGLAGVFARAAILPGSSPPVAVNRSTPTTPAPTLSFSAPSPSAQTPYRSRLVLRGTGDVNLDSNFIPNFRTFGYGYAWSGLKRFFRRDDLTVVNLECPVSRLGSAVLTKDYNFRADPSALPPMRAAGVDVANLANNHAYDYGADALLDTRRNLAENNIAAVGAGQDKRQALAPALFTIKGWRIAVVGLDEVVDGAGSVAGVGHPGVAAGHDRGAMVGAVKAAAGEADIVIVAVHWGLELGTTPSPADVSLAHRLIQAGADVIFGSHSHRLQPMETYRGRPIFYSLGNFVWPNTTLEGSTTAIAEVTVTRAGTFTGRLVPAFIQASGHPVLSAS